MPGVPVVGHIFSISCANQYLWQCPPWSHGLIGHRNDPSPHSGSVPTLVPTGRLVRSLTPMLGAIVAREFACPGISHLGRERPMDPRQTLLTGTIL